MEWHSQSHGGGRNGLLHRERDSLVCCTVNNALGIRLVTRAAAIVNRYFNPSCWPAKLTLIALEEPAQAIQGIARKDIAPKPSPDIAVLKGR
jgi:hypothetical protein